VLISLLVTDLHGSQVFLEMEDVYSAQWYMVHALDQGDPYLMKIFREN
jgi:hypothetical protein